MLITTDISYHYNSENKLIFPDLSFKRGEQAVIIGNSGCGKTTFLHLISGLLKPTTGSISIGETNLNTISGAKLDRFRGKGIGIVFQTPHFIDALSVKENLFLAQSLAGNKKDIIKIKIILKELNLLEKLNSKTKELSQGQKQRVSIARALINTPSLILADEPTSALDDENCTNVANLLKEQAKKHNATLLIVTHDNRISTLFETKIKL